MRPSGRSPRAPGCREATALATERRTPPSPGGGWSPGGCLHGRLDSGWGDDQHNHQWWRPGPNRADVGITDTPIAEDGADPETHTSHASRQVAPSRTRQQCDQRCRQSTGPELTPHPHSNEERPRRAGRSPRWSAMQTSAAAGEEAGTRPLVDLPKGYHAGSCGWRSPAAPRGTGARDRRAQPRTTEGGLSSETASMRLACLLPSWPRPQSRSRPPEGPGP